MTGETGPRRTDGAPPPPDGATGSAVYVFRVRFRIDPAPPEVTVDPATFETVLERAADPPGTSGWLFFRDNLWRGEVNDQAHVRTLTEDALGVPVEAVSFSELRTDDRYWGALREAIGADLAAFGPDSVDAVISAHLGSSVRLVDGG